MANIKGRDDIFCLLFFFLSVIWLYKYLIDQGLVNVNGVVEKRRRNKIIPTFVVGYNGFTVLIE